MQFHLEGKTFKAVRVTGPTHNFLGVEFAPPEAMPQAVLVESVHLNTNEPDRLTAEGVQDAVDEGIREANEALGTDYRLCRIVFVVSDSPPVTVYRELARRILLRHHTHSEAFDGIEG